MKTQINNVTLLTMNKENEVFENASIVFEDDKIIAINQAMDVDVVIDGNHAICMPGMVNTHAHLSMIPFRSLQDDCPDRLRKFLFPLEQSAMNETLAVAACKVGIAESLLSGVTSVFDMYYFPDALASCYQEMKLRAVVAETILEQATCDSQEPHGGLQIAEAFIQKWKGDGFIHPAIAPHAPNTNAEEALLKASELSRTFDVLISMHVSEMDYEMQHYQEKYQMTPIAYLESLGVLSERFVLAHGIHMQGSDFEILKKHGCGVAHCIGSNTKAAKGVAPVKEMLDHNIAVGLGTDGPASGNTLDLFTQMNLFAKFHKVAAHDRSAFPAASVVALATMGGARVLGLDHQIGSLEVGKKADIVLVETESINMFPMHDPFSALVYSANPSNVHSVWVNGIGVVKNKQLVFHDIKEIRRDCEEKMRFFTSEAKRLSQELSLAPKKT